MTTLADLEEIKGHLVILPAKEQTSYVGTIKNVKKPSWLERKLGLVAKVNFEYLQLGSKDNANVPDPTNFPVKKNDVFYRVSVM